MKAVRIIDTCNVWAEGVGAILTAVGVAVEISSPWPGTPIEIPRNQVMLIAKALLPPAFMPPGGGRDHGTTPRVVVVLHAADALSPSAFISSGLAGVLPSTAPREAVIDCLRSVLNHQRWIDPQFAPHYETHPPLRSDRSSLGHREFEVAALAARGLSNKRIAECCICPTERSKIRIHHFFANSGLIGAPS